jgi:Putative zinc-finger
MNENCFDIGTIQAFLDGELASDTLENVARHLSLCDECALHLATAEEETAFAFTALEQEFNNTLVPTHRLWAKINDSIERERKSFWKPILAFFRNPAMATFAVFLIVFGLFVAYLNSGNNNAPVTAEMRQSKSNAIVKVSNPPTIEPTDVQNPPERVSAPEKVIKNNRPANVIPASNTQKDTPKNVTPQTDVPNVQQVSYQYLPGEESYIKTIATLEKTIDQSKDQALKPSSRITFEKNLAIVNDAISKMKEEVKRNPKNESAKQILLSSYQNKVDLLNSVAANTEMMASLRR